jgi:hypothetical protein
MEPLHMDVTILLRCGWGLAVISCIVEFLPLGCVSEVARDFSRRGKLKLSPSPEKPPASLHSFFFLIVFAVKVCYACSLYITAPLIPDYFSFCGFWLSDSLQNAVLKLDAVEVATFSFVILSCIGSFCQSKEKIGKWGFVCCPQMSGHYVQCQLLVNLCSLFVSSFSSLLMERILRGLTDWYRVFKWYRSLALLSCKRHKPQKKIPASSS